MTRNKVIEYINQFPGRFYTVEFIKRTTGEHRTMTFRLGVTKHLKGGGPTYNFGSKGLLPVYDMVKKGYRSIPIESITKIKIRGEWEDIDNDKE